jgi:hypothetical protein
MKVFIIYFACFLATIYAKRVVIDRSGSESRVNQQDPVFQLIEQNIGKLNLTLVKIREVKQQAESGVLYKINGIFKDKDGQFFDCEVHMWLREWLNADEKLQFELKRQTKIDDIESALREDVMINDNSNSSSQVKVSNKFVFLLMVFLVFISI